MAINPFDQFVNFNLKTKNVQNKFIKKYIEILDHCV